MELHEGQFAPDFILPAVADDDTVAIKQVHLADLRGSMVILWFFARGDPYGNVIQAYALYDIYRECSARGVIVLGVGTDTLAAHKRFAVKYHFPFQLLSDADAAVSRKYGFFKEKHLFGTAYQGGDRSIVLIDKKGIIRKIWSLVTPGADEILSTIDALTPTGETSEQEPPTAFS